MKRQQLWKEIMRLEHLNQDIIAEAASKQLGAYVHAVHHSNPLLGDGRIRKFDIEQLAKTIDRLYETTKQDGKRFLIH